LAFLEREIPRLADEGIELVSISELVLSNEVSVGRLQQAK
jgi:hypothetical protein